MVNYDSAVIKLGFKSQDWHKNITPDLMRWLGQKMNWTISLAEPENAISLNRNGIARYRSIGPETYLYDEVNINFYYLVSSGNLEALRWPIERIEKGRWAIMTDPGTANLTNFRLGRPYRLSAPLDVFNGFMVVGDDKGSHNGYSGYPYIGMEVKPIKDELAKDMLLREAEQYIEGEIPDPKDFTFQTDIGGTLETKIRYKNYVVYDNGKFKTVTL